MPLSKILFLSSLLSQGASSQFTYSMIYSGRCGSVPGRHEIDSKSWCEEAAVVAKINPTYTEASSSLEGSVYTPGCFTNVNSLLYFNPHKITPPHLKIPSTVLCANDGRCLCATVSLCSVTDGTTSNAAAATTTCSCGAAICSATTGLYCESTHSQCSSSAISACTSSDGSSANSVTCVCGTTTCNSNTGLFCRSAQKSGLKNHPENTWYEIQITLMHPELLTGSEGSCSKTPIFYSIVNNGETCGSVNGRHEISDKDVCEEAVAQFAVALYNPLAPVSMSDTGYPPGCNAPDGGTVYLNSLLSFPPSSFTIRGCMNDNYRCLCATGPSCSETDGTTSNSDGCICNAAVCTTTTGLYCDNTTSTCSRGNACTFSNGSLANSGACPCGTSYCYSVTGFYCISSRNLCRKACSFGKYRSDATNGVCTKCPVGQHSDDASDMTRCKLW